jgi:signal transduction histidine kinase/CheY-like chemotaxis protein
MEKLQAFFKVSFGTKVLIPVVMTMMLLVALTAWTVNRLITEQFQNQAASSLRTANAVFLGSQKIFTQNLFSRVRNLVKEPRYKAAMQAGDMKTLKDLFSALAVDQDVDAVLFASPDGLTLAKQKRDPAIPLAEFESRSALATHQAFENEEKPDTIQVGDWLFDVVSVPVVSGSGELLGALTFGAKIGTREFKEVTSSEIVLLGNERVLASTLPGTDLNDQYAALFKSCILRPGKSSELRKVVLRDHHYFYTAGKLPTLNNDGKLGYLLLSSYEEPLRDLQSKQQTLIIESTLAILLGITLVWFVVKKVTEPVRQLRDSAEAVGKGDFSRRVEVKSGDECGELAWVFNQMTENLQRSRQQLEETVDTLKTTQAQLIQSEKLSGIGEFVAGVAHELNNPLTSVMGFSELLTKAEMKPQHKRHLDMIHKSALRCHKIVQSLLSFARRHQPERKLSSVNELIESAAEFLQYQLRTSNIEVVMKLDPGLPKAMIDPHQVQQVFLNIINNARQAIEGHRPDGQIRISTEGCGQNVRIVFQDNGPGISEQNLSKVFDPFFTTKELGKGTGLGLSLCYGIIKEHGGAITVRSKIGEGANFTIDLPSAPPSETTSNSASPAPLRALNPREGVGKRVLIIDDEEAILEMMRDMLSEQGYQVDMARDGESGLKRLNQVSYDLTLCDWKMPGINGQQVYERLRASHPEVSDRIIFITGDVVNQKTQAFLKESKKACLSKPFSIAEFREAVGKAMAPN